MMLNDHWNSTSNVLGRWENVKVDKDLLLGEPVFDLDDEKAEIVAGKVDRDFIKSCSMGITFNREDLQIIGEELIMTKCELYECSIVAVPSNANSIRLYSQNGELLKDEEVKELCLSLQQPTQPEPQNLDLNPNNDMKKITLSLAALAALSFDKATPEVDVEAVEAAVLSLSQDNNKMKAKILAFETASENAQTLAIEQMVTLAITEGKIPATKKEDFVKLAIADFELAKTTLSSIPAKTTLGNQTIVPTGGATTKEEFQKLSLDAQLAFKTTQPDEYNKMFNVKK